MLGNHKIRMDCWTSTQILKNGYIQKFMKKKYWGLVHTRIPHSVQNALQLMPPQTLVTNAVFACIACMVQGSTMQYCCRERTTFSAIWSYSNWMGEIAPHCIWIMIHIQCEPAPRVSNINASIKPVNYRMSAKHFPTIHGTVWLRICPRSQNELTDKQYSNLQCNKTFYGQIWVKLF